MTPSRKMELADPSAKKMRLPPAVTPIVDPAPDSAARCGDPSPTGFQEPIESRVDRISDLPDVAPSRIAAAPKSSQFGGALYGAPCPLISTVVSYLSSMILKSQSHHLLPPGLRSNPLHPVVLPEQAYHALHDGRLAEIP